MRWSGLTSKEIPAPACELSPSQQDWEFIKQAVAQVGDGPEAVIPVLQAIHARYHYLPRWALEFVCQLTQASPARVWGVATFYSQFRLRPLGRHRIQVCHGTACYSGGAKLVQQALEHHLGLAPGEDTDAERLFTVEKVACLGCCSLAPVIRIDDVTYGHLTPAQVPKLLKDFLKRHRDHVVQEPDPPSYTPPESCGELRVGLDSCCRAQGHDKIFRSIVELVRRRELPVGIKRVGCPGLCHQAPTIEVVTSGKRIFYVGVTPRTAARVATEYFPQRRWWRRVVSRASRWLKNWLGEETYPPSPLVVRAGDGLSFLSRQIRIATEFSGELDPLDLEEYKRRGGFAALHRALFELSPAEIIGEVFASGLRGRGGAGFPTGQKWALVARQHRQPKFVICNGDEGDPGAFMDRTILESFPFRVIEGMAIAAVATGCHQGFFYIRAEYPLAVLRIRQALEICRQAGLVGSNILGSSFSLDISLREGAGAFVCGEETALIASLEGKRGHPRFRPPYPAESGYHGQPTLINNVETLACVPWILRHGAEAFAAIGTATSKGTKVFALAGKVRRTGLIEVPMGITLREIVEELGGGVPEGRTLKAVQIGGPSGGCLPAQLMDLSVDYDSLAQAGAIMGSGGLVVFDNTDCMVDVARYFLQFTQSQSCGKCTFCRLGTRRMLEILEATCQGQAKRQDLQELEELARAVQQGSLCGLGKTAPNPVLSTLRYFRDEYEAHLVGQCPALRCKALIRYVISERCVGCTLCAQYCPARCIALTPYRRHRIEDAECTRCDTCRQVCPVAAVEVLTG